MTSRQALPSTSTGTGDADNAGSELVSGRGGSDSSAGVGRRGMHSACGAYWNNERDGMWSFKYETKGKIMVKDTFVKIGSGLTFRFIRNGRGYFCYLDCGLKGLLVDMNWLGRIEMLAFDSMWRFFYILLGDNATYLFTEITILPEMCFLINRAAQYIHGWLPNYLGYINATIPKLCRVRSQLQCRWASGRAYGVIIPSQNGADSCHN